MLYLPGAAHEPPGSFRKTENAVERGAKTPSSCCPPASLEKLPPPATSSNPRRRTASAAPLRGRRPICGSWMDTPCAARSPAWRWCPAPPRSSAPTAPGSSPPAAGSCVDAVNPNPLPPKTANNLYKHCNNGTLVEYSLLAVKEVWKMEHDPGLVIPYV